MDPRKIRLICFRIALCGFAVQAIGWAILAHLHRIDSTIALWLAIGFIATASIAYQCRNDKR